jgi:hypothetical protein
VSPLPGKCLREAATPVDWIPSTMAAPSLATSDGSSENARVPTAGLSWRVARSHTGAQSTVTPSARSSQPMAMPTRRARSADPLAPRAMFPGNWVAGGPTP